MAGRLGRKIKCFMLRIRRSRISILRSRNFTFWTCFPIRAGPDCTSAIPKDTPPRTSSRATSGCAALTFCTRWAGTRSVLPAEQYAIKTGQHPAVTTRENVAQFKSQLKRIGFSYDWQREINTTDPGYYKWTQWIFLQIYNSWFNPETQQSRADFNLSRRQSRQRPARVRGRCAGELVSRSWARFWPTKK